MRLWQLRVEDLFAKPGEIVTYEYYGRGWFGRPYSGGPWHQPEEVSEVVEKIPTITLHEVLQQDWSAEEPSDVQERLMLTCRLLWMFGERRLATQWFSRRQEFPEAGNRQAIAALQNQMRQDVQRSNVDENWLPGFHVLLREFRS